MTPVETLRAAPFFAGFSEPHLALVAGCAREQHYAQGSWLLRQNQVIHHCHLLCSGRVVLEACDTRGVCVPMQTLEAGAMLGWSWLQPPYQSFFEARALTAVTTLALDCASLRAAMEADHDFGYAFLQRATRPLMSRLQACRLQLIDVYAHPAETRR